MIRTALFLAPALLLSVGLLDFWLRRQRANFRRGLTFAANVGEGFHEDGRMSFLPDAALPSRYLLVKPGSDGSHMALAGAGDMPLGVCTDQTDTEVPDAFVKPLSVNLFGAVRGTQRGVAAGTIPAWSLLVPAANGQMQALPTATGTYWVFGRYVGKGALANGYVEFIPLFPRQVSVA